MPGRGRNGEAELFGQGVLDFEAPSSERGERSGGARELDQRDPRQWGELVLSRAEQGGDVLAIDPEIYWDKIFEWFRSHGKDPHPWHRA